MDRTPRELTAVQLNALQVLGRQVVAQLEQRLKIMQLEESAAQRTEAESALRESEQRYRDLVRAEPWPDLYPRTRRNAAVGEPNRSARTRLPTRRADWA